MCAEHSVFEGDGFVLDQLIEVKWHLNRKLPHHLLGTFIWLLWTFIVHENWGAFGDFYFNMFIFIQSTSLLISPPEMVIFISHSQDETNSFKNVSHRHMHSSPQKTHKRRQNILRVCIWHRLLYFKIWLCLENIKEILKYLFCVYWCGIYCGVCVFVFVEVFAHHFLNLGVYIFEAHHVEGFGLFWVLIVFRNCFVFFWNKLNFGFCESGGKGLYLMTHNINISDNLSFV